jgi:hypothetical protein
MDFASLNRSYDLVSAAMKKRAPSGVAKSVRGTQGVREPVRWSILVVGAKLQWLGDVEATSEAEAIAEGAEEFKQPKERLMAVRR